MHHGTEVLLSLCIIFIAAQIGAEIAQRLKMPSVVGEILAGCFVGPSVFNLVGKSEAVDLLSELGVVFLLYCVGLDTKISDLKKVGVTAFSVGVGGVILPFAAGIIWALSLGYLVPKALFLAAALVATSVGITARVLQELGFLQRTESKVILGAAIVDDILAMLLLGIVSAYAYGDRSTNLFSIGYALLQSVLFIAAVIYVGSKVIKKHPTVLEAPINPLSPLTLSLAFCLGLSYLSSHFGLAVIIGAFLAGVVMAESPQQKTLEHQMQPLLSFFAPFFFVVTGMNLDLSTFQSTSSILMVLGLTALAALTKFIGCGAAAYKLGKKSAITIGIGMIPRGEVGIIVASLGLSAGVFTTEVYGLVVLMSLLTAIITPPLLKWSFKS